MRALSLLTPDDSVLAVYYAWGTFASRMRSYRRLQQLPCNL